MNRYGNKYGYHNPTLTELLFRRIEKEVDVKWIDTSWHNDGSDSMQYTVKFTATPMCHEFIEVYLPNSTIEDRWTGEYNTFNVLNERRDVLLTTVDIEELIEFLNKTI
jgi:hypothetical protein